MQSSVNRKFQRDASKWLFLVGCILTFAGYFGPWVDHKVAGLVVTGLDLGEYVKFLPAVRSGQISLWREGFYLPLFTVSLLLSLHAFRDDYQYGWTLRALLLTLAVIAALNMLPPAWAPWKLVLPEFRLQTAAIFFCLGAMLFSPFLALLPSKINIAIALVLTLLTLVLPILYFLRILPGISTLYNRSLWPGWGIYVMAIGCIIVLIGVIRSKESN